MKLLLRSMDASSTVVGPATAPPPQLPPLPPAAEAWRAACIPPSGRASGERGTGRSEEGKSSERAPLERVEWRGSDAPPTGGSSAAASLFYCPPPPLSS